MSALAASDRLAAGLFGLLAFALVAPWPRPSVPLREACELAEAGRFAVQCDLVAAAERTGKGWLRRGIRVYEDGLLLRQADRAADVRRENPGSYHTTGLLLTLAALDRSDPRQTGHDYSIRPAQHNPLGLTRDGRRVALVVLLVAFGLLCVARRSQLEPLALHGAIAAAVSATLVQVVAVLLATPVHVDDGYWLPGAEAVARGARPYTGLAFLYTPLGLYEFALWGRLWDGAGPPPYAWYLGFVLLNELACAAMVFVLLRHAGGGRALALLTAVGLFSMTLWFDGGRILFEPLYLLLGLVSAWLLLSSSLPASRVGAGLLAALAFFTKQYGGIVIWGLMGSALTTARERWRQALTLALGFALGLLALSLLLIGLGLDLKGLVVQSSGQSYPRRYEATWFKVFLWQCSIVVPALAVPLLPGAWSRPAVRVAVCFALASCMPFYFRQHQYYFLTVCPWLFLLFALGVEHTAAMKARLRPALVAGAALLLLAMPLRGALAQTLWFENEARSDQLRRGFLMTAAWPGERRTLLFAYPGFYAVTHYRSADEPVVGYRFLNEASLEQLRVGFQKAEGAWIDPNGMYARGADRTLREAGTSLEEQLQQHGFTKKLVLEERFELWTKSP